MARGRLYVGTAHWGVPKSFAHELPDSGTLLARYATLFSAVEINSTFYRLPRRATVERWRDQTPPSFRFSVKLPRSITHEACLRGIRAELGEFIELCRVFGKKLGPILVQLPPSLALHVRSADAFFAALRGLHPGGVALEPRHPSFFSERASELLLKHRIARVAADPARCPGAGQPGGERSLVYYRLHGSPRMYFDVYGAACVAALVPALRAEMRQGSQVWCIFDNNALGGAAHDALALLRASMNL